jgi:AmpE protein
MKLLVLLVVLALRRLDLTWPSWLSANGGMEGLQQWLAQKIGDHTQDLMAWCLRVAAPALLVAWGMLVLHGWFWGLAGWIGGALLLLWLLGAESEFRHLDDMIVRGRMNDPEGLGKLAEKHFQAEGMPGDPGYFAALTLRILHRDSGHLFATVFFLITLGYWAAFLYLANRWLCRHPEQAGAEAARVVDAAMFWLPSRLLIVILALAGDFRRVMDAVDGRMLQLEDNRGVLEDAVIASLDLAGEPDPDDMPAGVDLLEALQALLLRCLAMWLIVSAVWIMLV